MSVSDVGESSCEKAAAERGSELAKVAPLERVPTGDGDNEMQGEATEQQEAEDSAEPAEPTRIEPSCVSSVSELHASLQLLVGRLHDAVYMLPGRAVGSGEEARAKILPKGYASDLLEAGRRFEHIAAGMPVGVRHRSEDRLKGEFADLEQADRDAGIDLDRYHSRVLSLQHAVSREIRRTCAEMCGDSMVCSWSTSVSEPVMPQSQPSGSKGLSIAGSAPVPRLQDLVQEKPRRFVEELEFVECLASPEYVHWLSQQTYFENPSFIAFLKYLSYWRSPPHVYYVRFPQALRMLEMMSNAQVRSRLRDPGVGVALTDQLMERWAHKLEVGLEASVCSPGASGPTTSSSPQVSPAPTPPKSVPERQKRPKTGADVLRECDVLQDWTCLTGNVLANDEWHRKVEQAESGKITVQAMAELLGRSFLEKKGSGQQLEEQFEKNRHIWRCKAGSGDIAEALVNLRPEEVPKTFAVPPSAIKTFLTPTSVAPVRKRVRLM